MAQGFLYLVALLDWYSRKVLAWKLSNLRCRISRTVMKPNTGCLS